MLEFQIDQNVDGYTLTVTHMGDEDVFETTTAEEMKNLVWEQYRLECSVNERTGNMRVVLA